MQLTSGERMVRPRPARGQGPGRRAAL